MISCRIARLVPGVVVLGALSFSTTPTRADSVSLTSADRGSYGRSGFHSSADKGYVVGVDDGYRNFFVFDLIGIGGNVVAARLELYNYAGGASGTAPLTLFDVTTPAGTLTRYHADATAIFDDLGSGVTYGSVADASTPVVTIELNDAFLDAINNRQSDRFALGGRLGNPSHDGAYAFASSGTCFGGPRLVLDFAPAQASAVPLPGVAAAGLALFGTLAARRRK